MEYIMKPEDRSMEALCSTYGGGCSPAQLLYGVPCPGDCQGLGNCPNKK